MIILYLEMIEKTANEVVNGMSNDIQKTFLDSYMNDKRNFNDYPSNVLQGINEHLKGNNNNFVYLKEYREKLSAHLQSL